MIHDHPVIQYMERDVELPSWYHGPIFDETDTNEDWEYEARREEELFDRN